MAVNNWGKKSCHRANQCKLYSYDETRNGGKFVIAFFGNLMCEF